MTAPSITVGTYQQLKSSGTTMPTCTAPTGVFAIGDLLIAHLAMDPATGTVTFGAPSAGTWGGWTVIRDVAQGSGTSGVRVVVAYNRASAVYNSTAPTVTGTIPTATARVLRLYAVTAVASAGAVNASNTGTSSSAGTYPSAAVTVVTGGFDALFACFAGSEYLAQTLTRNGNPGGAWTAGTTDASTFGTSGSSGGSNIAVGVASWTAANAPAGATAACGAGSASATYNADVNVVFAGSASVQATTVTPGAAAGAGTAPAPAILAVGPPARPAQRRPLATARLVPPGQVHYPG